MDDGISGAPRTPLAVRMGRALSLGSKAFLYSSGTALMMSTSLGMPPKPCFLDMRARISLRETEVLALWALMSSAAMPEVTRSSCSACDGPEAVDCSYVGKHSQ
jgi:hypothetical protein